MQTKSIAITFNKIHNVCVIKRLNNTENLKSIAISKDIEKCLSVALEVSLSIRIYGFGDLINPPTRLFLLDKVHRTSGKHVRAINTPLNPTFI